MVSKIVATKGIEYVKSLKISLHKPIRPMLAERVRTSEEALKKMGGTEYKLDGERVQIHKGEGDSKVELFSRRLEKITNHYPHIVKAINNSCLIDLQKKRAKFRRWEFYLIRLCKIIFSLFSSRIYNIWHKHMTLV